METACPAGGGAGGAALAKINSIILQQGYLLQGNGVLKDGITITNQVTTTFGTRIEYNVATFDYADHGAGVESHYLFIPGSISDTNQREPAPEEQCSTCLIPGTAGRNLWGTNYTGANNPMSFNRTANYSLPPKNLSDWGSMGHDLNYDKYHAVGPNSVMTDTRTIGADYQFIAWQLSLTSPFSPLPTTPAEKLQGLTSGLYMFIFTFPKTFFNGLTEIKN